jgi:hypothetical protein
MWAEERLRRISEDLNKKSMSKNYSVEEQYDPTKDEFTLMAKYKHEKGVTDAERGQLMTAVERNFRNFEGMPVVGETVFVRETDQTWLKLVVTGFDLDRRCIKTIEGEFSVFERIRKS